MPLTLKEQLKILVDHVIDLKDQTDAMDGRLAQVERILSNQKIAIAFYATAIGGIISAIVGIFFKMAK